MRNGPIVRIENLDGIQIYPNPVNANEQDSFILFNNLTENSNITIYNLSGEIIFNYKTSDSKYNWDLKNNNKKKVASGVYIYLITNDRGESKIGKLAIIR